MNVIHAADFVMQAMFISASAWLVVLCLKRAERKARVALIGILACGVMPWFAAWIPVRKVELPRPQVIRMEIPAVREVVMPAAPEPVVRTAEVRDETPMAEPRKLDPATGLSIIWLCGVLAGLAFMVRELWITRRWMRTLVSPEERQSESLRAAGFHGRDRLLISQDGPGPCVAGFFNPVVVVPAWLLESGREMELEWTLRHELEHLRGHDSRWVLLIRLVRCLQWWNPFAHLLARSWDQSRERVCDLRALRHSEEVPDYGRFLLVVAARNPGLIAAASMACGRPAKRLRRRIASLLNSGSPKPAPAGAGWSIAVGMFLLGVSVVSSGFGFAGEKVAEAKDDDDLSWLEPKPVREIKVMALLSPEPLARHGEVLTNEGFKSLLARYARMKNGHVQILGWGIVEPTGPLTIQLTANRDNSLAVPPWDGTREVGDFVGWVFRAEMDGAELKTQLVYAFPPGNHPAPSFHIPTAVSQLPGLGPDISDTRYTPPPVLPEGIGWQQVEFKEGRLKSRIESGKYVCLSLGEVEKGINALCVIQMVERMPWQNSRLRESVESNDGKIISVETRKLVVEKTAEQERLDEDLRRENLRLQNATELLPENQNLLKLRKEFENELSNLTEDDEARRRLQWKINSIRIRMCENRPMNLQKEAMENQKKRWQLNAIFLGKYFKGEDEKSGWPKVIRGFEYRHDPPDPTKFNNQEQ